MVPRIDSAGTLAAHRFTRLQPKTQLSDTDVASLTSYDIASMSRAQLVTVIRAIRLAVLRPDVEAGLEKYDRPALERLVYLTRRHCQQRLSMTRREPAGAAAQKYGFEP